MATLLNHSPAQIIRQVLIDLGLGSASGAWPVYYSEEPDRPDNVITVYDTQGRDFGSYQVTGERVEHHGISVRIRAATYAIGWKKARAIAVALDESIHVHSLVLEDAAYCVHATNRTSAVVSLGEEEATSRRLFTVNAVVNLKELA